MSVGELQENLHVGKGVPLRVAALLDLHQAEGVLRTAGLRP